MLPNWMIPAYMVAVLVVIGDVRIARGLTRRECSKCPHKHMVYDQNERRIWCEDCERAVEVFDALMQIVENLEGFTEKTEREEKGSTTTAAQFQLRSHGGEINRRGMAEAEYGPGLTGVWGRPLPGRLARMA